MRAQADIVMLYAVMTLNVSVGMPKAKMPKEKIIGDQEPLR